MGSTQEEKMTEIAVNTEQPYVVKIGHDLVPELLADIDLQQSISKLVIFYQHPLEHIAKAIQNSSSVEVFLHEIPDGEDSKTIETAARCWDVCAHAELGRTDAIIGIGGGAATDLAGFIAATWMRGIQVFQYPTTLLAMVDAAVGGKTGINIASGKNLVGAFHEPACVYVDLDVLATLPRKELIAGSAEIIKAGFIADSGIVDIYESDPDAALDVHGSLPELISRAIHVKSDVVSQDLKESSLREILNFGHTFAHAIEKAENYHWSHGNAVAVGMIYEAELAVRLGLLDRSVLDRLYSILLSVGLPVAYSDTDFVQLLDTMGLDKKNKSGVLRFATIEDIAQPIRVEGPDTDLLEKTYSAINEGKSND